jgi:glycosyltransferase involved in cell wall biosynthesis
LKTISIVTPCYNEEDNIRACYETVRALFDGTLKGYRREHIFCDNASKDRTPEILQEIAAADPGVKVILNARNFGPMKSNYNGVRAASGDATILSLPADLQDPPELIVEFVRLWEQGYERVYGIRANREEGFPMLQVRKLYYRVISRISDVDMPPDVGDFQLVDKKVLTALQGFNDAYPFMRAMTFECGFKAVGVPYTCRARARGMSKNRLYHLIDQGLNGLISFSSVPMRMALSIGLLLSALSIVFAFLNVILTLILDQSVPSGTPLIITAIFFFAGVQLFFIGFLGEYVIAIFNQVRNRPLVIERARINFDRPPRHDPAELPAPPRSRKARKTEA